MPKINHRLYSAFLVPINYQFPDIFYSQPCRIQTVVFDITTTGGIREKTVYSCNNYHLLYTRRLCSIVPSKLPQ